MNPPARAATVGELAPAQGGEQGGEPLAPWLIVLAGLRFLYAPSFIHVFRTIWSPPTRPAIAEWFRTHAERQRLLRVIYSELK